MNRKHEPAIWPYVLVLAMAFVLTLAKPRPWAPPEDSPFALAAGFPGAPRKEKAGTRLSIRPLPRPLPDAPRVAAGHHVARKEEGGPTSPRRQTMAELTQAPAEVLSGRREKSLENKQPELAQAEFAADPLIDDAHRVAELAEVPAIILHAAENEAVGATGGWASWPVTRQGDGLERPSSSSACKGLISARVRNKLGDEQTSHEISHGPSAANDGLAGRPADEPTPPRDSSRMVDSKPNAAAPTSEQPPQMAARPTSSLRNRFHARPGKIAKTSAHHEARLWGEPTALLDQLDTLASDCETGLWAAQVGDALRELCRQDDWQSPRTDLALKQLRDLVDANHPLLALPPGSPHAGPLRRMRYAVLRRLDLWELVPELAAARPGAGGRGQTVSLTNDSRRAAVASANVTRLLAHLERFEQTGLTDDGRDIVADVSHLAGRDEKLAARTHRWLEWNYRNSNLRLVCSRELLNRLVPVQPAQEEPVYDRILGIPTRGWSTSTARLSIHLVPDPRTVHFTLEAKGVVVARTASRRDPVTVYSNSDSAYLARKQMRLSADGLQTWPTEAEVSNNSRLRGIETDYDDVPLFGFLVERIARAKHAEKEPAVRRVARRKVATRVQEELDAAIEAKLTQARRQYHQRVTSPLEGLSLEPAVIEMQTADTRLTGRLRLAGDEQLAACTPRPMALADSLASMQMHQSLVNNICDRLDLDGHTFTLPKLQKRLVKAFRLPPEALAEEYPSDLRITFAERDALIVRFDEGRIELTLSVAELHKHPKVWHDFRVRVYYRPRVKGLDVRFVRDGTVRLRGEHFGREPQIVLRGIFSKVFSQDRELAFLDAAKLADPRLNGLGVTQCVLTDGWIGLSLGASASPRQAMRCVGPRY